MQLELGLTVTALESQAQAVTLEEWVYSVQNPDAARKGKSEQGSGVADETSRLAVPRRGHVLSTTVEIYGKPVREAVAVLSGSLGRIQCSEVRATVLLPRYEPPGPEFIRSDAEMLAWSTVSMWVVGVAAKAFTVAASLADAETWFFGRDRPGRLTELASTQTIKKAEAALRAEANDSAYLELLPYILDPHGPGSRLSVRRDPATSSARKRKRTEGVFYTPVDVAEYMAGICLAEVSSSESPPTVFDPACGTGVFLRAALREIRRRYSDRDALSITFESLFGADIDPWPLDATAFVLLADIWGELKGKGIVPAEAWRQMRMNFACVDTLRIDPAEDFRNDVPLSMRVAMSRLFPALKHGPMVVLGNPPYAGLGQRSDLAEVGRVFETLAVKPDANAEIYLPFIEQMIRLAERRTCSGALVLPLSVACNVGEQFSTVRELISKTRGRWRFAFFDREPHALFGEDVKTRNAIMLWSRTPSDREPVLFTGPLRKWRGDSRAEMFRSLRFTEIERAIRAGIPKIEGDRQAAALRALDSRWCRLEQFASIARIDVSKTPDADDRMVFVGATAYNFLNTFLRPHRDVLKCDGELSEHPLHAIRCASRRDALAVFAIFSSHLAYWWWHTHGDGFHVSRRFLAEFPFGAQDLTDEVIGHLSEHGEQLWSDTKARPIISLNRGRTSLAFTPNGHHDLRRGIDQVLAALAGLEDAFVDELQQFTARTVAATQGHQATRETKEEA